MISYAVPPPLIAAIANFRQEVSILISYPKYLHKPSGLFADSKVLRGRAGLTVVEIYVVQNIVPLVALENKTKIIIRILTHG